MDGFIVTETRHGEDCAGCRDCAEAGAIYARVTGSKGANYTVDSHDPTKNHSARVKRIPKEEG